MDKIFIVMEYVEHDLKALMETMSQPFLQGGWCETDVGGPCPVVVYDVSGSLIITSILSPQLTPQLFNNHSSLRDMRGAE